MSDSQSRDQPRLESSAGSGPSTDELPQDLTLFVRSAAAAGWTERAQSHTYCCAVSTVGAEPDGADAVALQHHVGPDHRPKRALATQVRRCRLSAALTRAPHTRSR